jgi:hypothetical protein
VGAVVHDPERVVVVDVEARRGDERLALVDDLGGAAGGRDRERGRLPGVVRPVAYSVAQSLPIARPPGRMMPLAPRSETVLPSAVGSASTAPSSLPMSAMYSVSPSHDMTRPIGRSSGAPTASTSGMLPGSDEVRKIAGSFSSSRAAK